MKIVAAVSIFLSLFFIGLVDAGYYDRYDYRGAYQPFYRYDYPYYYHYYDNHNGPYYRYGHYYPSPYYPTPYLRGYPPEEDFTFYDSRNLRESWNNTNSNGPPY